MLFVDVTLATIVSGLAIPVIVFFVETLAATFLPTGRDVAGAAHSRRGRVAVLIPAHNESSGIRETIDDIRVQLSPDDTLLVIADNCTDDTSSIARAAGAEVIERNDISKVGKGYAIDWGLSHLRACPPDVVIVIDADCRLSINAIDKLAKTCIATGQPTQSLYLMTAPEGARVDYRVAQFAFRVKNWIRPLGLRALGLPCQLMGTGMAFPWSAISPIDIASSETVEDLKLGLDLAMSGHPPTFCPIAVVTSEFPTLQNAALNQRERWEHGHIRMILSAAPRVILRGLINRKLTLLMMGLDLAVPPLTVLMFLTAGTAAASACMFLAGFSSIALVISALNLATLIAAVFLCWFTRGRDILPPHSIFALFAFALNKLVLYRKMMTHRGPTEWIRTNREKE